MRSEEFRNTCGVDFKCCGFSIDSHKQTNRNVRITKAPSGRELSPKVTEGESVAEQTDMQNKALWISKFTIYNE